MSDRAHRCVYLETTLLPDDMRTTFEQCGDIRGIYSAGSTDNPAILRYYVEYREQRGAKHARTLRIPDTTVHALQSSPHLLDLFHSVASPNLPPKPPADLVQKARWAPYSKKKARHAQPPKDKSRPSTYTIIEPATTMSCSSFTHPEGFSRPHVDSFEKENRSQIGPAMDWENPLSESPVSMDNPAYTTAYMHPDGQSFTSSLSGFTDLSSSSSALSGSYPMTDPFVPGLMLNLNTSSSMMFGGDHLHINLDALDESPDAVIEVLKMAASHPLECGKWIVVGAHYRGQGNVASAVAVITTMIEVMLAVGMDISQLRPAVLMLSSCHLDVARKLRALNGTDTAESKIHLEKACEGFRQVYGSYDPPPFRTSMHARALSETNANSNANANLAATVNTSVRLDSVAVCASPPADSPVTPKAAARTAEWGVTPGTPAGSKGSPSGPRYGQVKMLEREIQSLRDKQQKQQDSLYRARSAKRKMQDELDREQHRRRKLEGQLEKAEKAAAGAQRGEEFALEQCRAEVETRRHAEDRVEELRERIAAIEPRVAESEDRDRKTREYFGKLGVAFLRAARGDMGDVPTIARIP